MNKMNEMMKNTIELNRKFNGKCWKYFTKKELIEIYGYLPIWYKERKIFFTHYCDGTYYVSEIGKKGLQIDNMTRTDLFNLWWSVFKKWVKGDK